MPSQFRKGEKVRHKLTGWEGIVSSVRAQPIPKATIKFKNGKEHTLHQSSLEKV